MKLCLLDMVQSILNDMDSDPVNGINDTTESLQVVSIIRDSYYKLISTKDDWPFLRTLTALNGLGDVNNPTKMQIPDALTNIQWVKYNKKDVCYMAPKDFNDMIVKRVPQTGVVDANGFGLNVDPSWWTSYDDTFLVMDSRNSAVDTTLQGSKSAVYGTLIPTWQQSNNFVPVLPDKMFPMFLADAKGTAFLVLKQQGNAKEESYAAKSKDRMTAVSRRVVNSESKTNSAVNFGRK